MACHLTGSIVRGFQKLLIDQSHELQIQVVLSCGRIIHRGSANPKKITLLADAEPRMIDFDHLLPPGVAHRPKAFAKKSRSTVN